MDRMDPVQVIAEYGQTMGGSIDTAHDQVDAARRAGCTAFKTQLLDPEMIASAGAAPYWANPKVTTQRQSFEKSGLIPYQAWREVAEHCAELDLDFVATPFDLYAVEILAQWNTVYKIASGDLTNVPLLRAVADHATRPVIVSTGAATEAEVLRAAAELAGNRVVWLACTLVYPAKLGQAELGRIPTLRHLILQSNYSNAARQFGYSDHVGKPASAIGAVCMGAQVLEVHTTLTPGDTDCPDDAMALDEAHLADYVTAANVAAGMVGDGRLHPIPEETAARTGAQRSLHFSRSLEAGHILNPADLVALRPGGGVSPLEWDSVVGAELTTPVVAGDQVRTRSLR